MKKVPFDMIYKEYQPLIYGTLKKFSVYQNREDILQEARMALWEAYQKFDPERGKFAAYAAKYVRGRVKRYITIQNRHKHVYPYSQLRTEDEELSFEVPDVQAQQAYQKIEWQEQLQEKKDLLSNREKIILEEHLLKEYTLKEIARKEQVSYDAVRSWKKRALFKLRQAYK